jgi:hypothetical protein
MKVLILGCGPSGLLAAYAADERGYDVRIASKKIKSVIPGAVYLHEPVEGLTASMPDGEVEFIKRGDRRGYAAKVYGSPDARCSWDSFPEGTRPAWSMFAIYDKLWKLYNDRIENVDIDAKLADEYERNIFDLVISTIPAPIICSNSEHKFPQQRIYLLDKSVDSGLVNGILYNGDPRDHWYRTSNIFGSQATESTIPFEEDLIDIFKAKTAIGFKPLWNDCDCHPHINRIGRYGRWTKGILVHQAYNHTVQLLEEQG